MPIHLPIRAFIDAAFAQDANLIEAATFIGLAIPRSVLYRADSSDQVTEVGSQ